MPARLAPEQPVSVACPPVQQMLAGSTIQATTRVALEIPPRRLKPLAQTPQERPTPRAQPAAPAPAVRSPLELQATEPEAQARDALTERLRLALQCQVTPRSEQKTRRSIRRSTASAKGAEWNAVNDRSWAAGSPSIAAIAECARAGFRHEIRLLTIRPNRRPPAPLGFG
jgi:hypothetical protein